MGLSDEELLAQLSVAAKAAMGLPEEELLAKLSAAAARVDDLETKVVEATEERDQLILAAIAAKIARVKIKSSANLSLPMIYKIRREKGGKAKDSE